MSEDFEREVREVKRANHILVAASRCSRGSSISDCHCQHVYRRPKDRFRGEPICRVLTELGGKIVRSPTSPGGEAGLGQLDARLRSS